jgi:chaperonin cofactor prefoldin
VQYLAHCRVVEGVVSKTMQAGLAIGVLAAIVVVLVLALPRKDICMDTVRGFKAQANSSVGVIRSGFDSLKGTLGTESSLQVREIENLDALNFSVLRSCETSCQILSQCLRFVFFQAPSAACPQEYRDLKDTQSRAEGVLERLSTLAKQVNEAKAQAPQVQKARQEVQELEKSPGATGTRLAQARATQSKLEGDLSSRLSRISLDLTELRKQEK